MLLESHMVTHITLHQEHYNTSACCSPSFVVVVFMFWKEITCIRGFFSGIVLFYSVGDVRVSWVFSHIYGFGSIHDLYW